MQVADLVCGAFYGLLEGIVLGGRQRRGFGLGCGYSRGILLTTITQEDPPARGDEDESEHPQRYPTRSRWLAAIVVSDRKIAHRPISQGDDKLFRCPSLRTPPHRNDHKAVKKRSAAAWRLPPQSFRSKSGDVFWAKLLIFLGASRSMKMCEILSLFPHE